MIKLKGTHPKSGRDVIVLGIEERNVERLKQGHPIHIHCDELGFKIDIVIHYEETMEKLVEAFQGNIGPKTRVHDSRNDKKN
jgi:formylmethanofuran dehydrogenase subunit A